MKRGGIYVCRCLINGGIYIGQTGSTVGFKNRWRTEKWCLENSANRINRHWLNAWKKYGKINFEFRIQEECCDELLDQREKAWIKYYKEAGYNIYNFTDGGQTNHSCSEETREKHRQAWLGRKHTEETKRKMSIAQKGKVFSEQTIKKMSLSQIGNKNNLGKHHTQESKAKLSEIRKKWWINKKRSLV